MSVGVALWNGGQCRLLFIADARRFVDIKLFGKMCWELEDVFQPHYWGDCCDIRGPKMMRIIAAKEKP
jgi:hypothetical protein